MVDFCCQVDFFIICMPRKFIIEIHTLKVKI